MWVVEHSTFWIAISGAVTASKQWCLLELLFFTPFHSLFDKESPGHTSSAQASHVLVPMWHIFIFLLQASLKCRRDLPVGWVPSANSPYSRFSEMQPLFILLMWPSQRRRLSRRWWRACCSCLLIPALLGLALCPAYICIGCGVGIWGLNCPVSSRGIGIIL